MEKGTNYNVSYLLRYIGEDKQKELDSYIQEMNHQDYQKFSDESEVNNTFASFLNEYLSRLNNENLANLRSYTGLQFRNVNAVLRNNWNYEVNGRLTSELKEESLHLAEEIRHAINKAPQINGGIKTYRGVSIATFQSYNIFTLNDLYALEGKYLYEEGFTSTSLIKEKSFFYTDPFTLNGKPNILIEYLIPDGSDDGIALLSDEISYSPNQAEFLINSSTLFRVISVSVDEKNNVAYMKVLLIPQRIWNTQDYEMERISNNLSK